SPEFLRQGVAVQDTLAPDRIVIGYEDDWAGERLREVFAHVVAESGCPLVETDLATAELIKHASNGYLAMRISYVNNLALLCERVGANVDVVTAGMGHDDRIGPHFMRAGIGYGGSCFPKDLDAFVHLTEHLGQDATLMRAVRQINATMRDHVIEKLRSRLWHFDEKIVVILGASFKPDTDDTREAPGLHIGRRLADEGATVRVYDPMVDVLPDWAGDDLLLTNDLNTALPGAHAALVATEWPEVRAITPDDFKAAMAYPIVIDGRNVYDVATMRNAGIMYDSVGRP
ncbi:MAG TPA: nucleotide sugar dehydrogenase, partial [Nitriliruptoraceae bacterium]|nr:nucleotide sugar dehydrogenase [Nitriliruptoraceae bacterium]